MARHTTAPSDDHQYIFGLTGLADGEPLQLRTVSVDEPLTAEDIAAMGTSSVSDYQTQMLEGLYTGLYTYLDTLQTMVPPRVV